MKLAQTCVKLYNHQRNVNGIVGTVLLKKISEINFLLVGKFIRDHVTDFVDVTNLKVFRYFSSFLRNL